MTDYITLAQLTSREKDAILLGTISGATYHEVSYVLKTDASGAHQIVGRASDWPLIQVRAENSELSSLLASATQQAEQADAVALAAQSRVSELETQLAALRKELDQAALIPPAVATAATGLAEPVVAEPEDRPGAFVCPKPGCGASFDKERAVRMHCTRAHRGYYTLNKAEPPESAVPPVRVVTTPIMLLADDPKWRCATCNSNAFTRSLPHPDLCIRCALAASNGHAREVGATS